MYKLGLSLYSTKNTALQNLQKTLSSPILYRANPSRKAANAPPVKKNVSSHLTILSTRCFMIMRNDPPRQ